MYDTLIIIGNGFDIWQGLHTSYSQFQNYYLKHREEILRKLKLTKYKVKNTAGETKYLSDVELFYGNPFKPGELKKEFWYTFEASLDDVSESYPFSLLPHILLKHKPIHKSIVPNTVRQLKSLRTVFVA